MLAHAAASKSTRTAVIGALQKRLKSSYDADGANRFSAPHAFASVSRVLAAAAGAAMSCRFALASPVAASPQQPGGCFHARRRPAACRRRVLTRAAERAGAAAAAGASAAAAAAASQRQHAPDGNFVPSYRDTIGSAPEASSDADDDCDDESRENGLTVMEVRTHFALPPREQAAPTHETHSDSAPLCVPRAHAHLPSHRADDASHRWLGRRYWRCRRG